MYIYNSVFDFQEFDLGILVINMSMYGFPCHVYIKCMWRIWYFRRSCFKHQQSCYTYI